MKRISICFLIAAVPLGAQSYLSAVSAVPASHNPSKPYIVEKPLDPKTHWIAVDVYGMNAENNLDEVDRQFAIENYKQKVRMKVQRQVAGIEEELDSLSKEYGDCSAEIAAFKSAHGKLSQSIFTNWDNNKGDLARQMIDLYDAFLQLQTQSPQAAQYARQMINKLYVYQNIYIGDLATIQKNILASYGLKKSTMLMYHFNLWLSRENVLLDYSKEYFADLDEWYAGLEQREAFARIQRDAWNFAGKLRSRR